MWPHCPTIDCNVLLPLPVRGTPSPLYMSEVVYLFFSKRVLFIKRGTHLSRYFFRRHFLMDLNHLTLDSISIVLTKNILLCAFHRVPSRIRTGVCRNVGRKEVENHITGLDQLSQRHYRIVLQTSNWISTYF